MQSPCASAEITSCPEVRTSVTARGESRILREQTFHTVQRVAREDVRRGPGHRLDERDEGLEEHKANTLVARSCSM
jgi:hypothetical protein